MRDGFIPTNGMVKPLVGLAFFASTATAAYNAASTQNVAIYWGQGNSQITLSEACADPSVDVVNVAFVNGFPLNVGDYPKTNFANACWGDYYEHPTDPTQDNKLLKTCPSIEPGIAACQAAGKKVLLSLGGGAPNDYYIPSEEVATYFAEFLIGAWGPPTAEWTGPRPFGNAAVDGFDLDLEADASQVPSGGISANYAFFVNELKRLQSSLLISSAPQCQVPDARLADAITNAPFDMIFTQFYNTDECSAKLGYQQISQSSTGFTFNKWADWLVANSKNKGVKLYMGLPAGTDGLPTHKDHYLAPNEASALVTKWSAQYPSIFGGVMLWEATVSAKNIVNCQNYAYWMKATLQGKFTSQYKACVSSSSSSIKPSSTKASSTVASTTSAAVTPTATVRTPDGSCGDKKNGLVYTCEGYNFGSCCSVYGNCGGNPSAPGSREAYCGTGCNPLYGECDSISSSSSSKVSSTKASSTPSSTKVSSTKASSASSTKVSSTKASSASSTKVSSTKVSSASSTKVSSASSTKVSSASSTKVSASSVYSASTPAASSSAPHSSVKPSSSVASLSGSISFTPYSSGTPSSSVGYPSSVPTIVYPAGTTKSVYPHSSVDIVYSSQSSSAPYPIYNNASTPCSTSTKARSTPAGYYGASSTPGYPAYDAYPPTVTSKPGQDYPSYPASSTVKVVTTTYVDSCETGVTTKTEVITKTVCAKCQDSVTSTYVCAAGKCGPSVVTVTITKPYSPPTDVPAKPSSPPTYGGDKPQPPAKPSTPSYGGEKPPNNTPVYDVPKKQEAPTSTTVSIVYITKTPVPVVPVSSVKYTPIPYPSAPAKNGTSSYPVKPTGTGSVPSKATGYTPPQFTGAASQVGVGMTGVLAVVAGLMAL
ncbi:glycoside hydrolase [Setomelanomma holmii]|uniref:chitinase n=1 Tax=Setomelanomma holmii TaxID=210430 RepID=A0A9P4HAS8_9PLEO|nr:glycoside hydrolase [Setomelanomma holmii]